MQHTSTQTFVRPATVRVADPASDTVLVSASAPGNDALAGCHEPDLEPARPALPFGYRPGVGDEVLIAHDEAGRAYVLGILSQASPGARLEVDGDLHLRSRRGRVRVEGQDGVSVRSSRVELEGDVVSVVARTFRRTVHDAYLKVKRLFHARYGRQHVDVDQSSTLRAERTHVLARGEVKIDGRSIHLG